jgi:hypothetical protein
MSRRRATPALSQSPGQSQSGCRGPCGEHRPAAATVRADPDRLLLASVEDLALSEGFRAYLKRLNSMRDKHVNELVSQADPTQFYRTQGRIEALAGRWKSIRS